MDLERKVSELEAKKVAANKWFEELETEKILLEKQIKIFNEKQPDTTPFHIQAYSLQRKIMLMYL